MSTGKSGNLWAGCAPKRDVPAQAQATSLAPHEVINDATGYGVQIQPANVAPGTLYWQAVRVHHRTPEENGGNHHIYLDVFDPTLGGVPYGGRVDGARLRVTWDGGEQIVTVDKPANEPGNQLPHVEMAGMRGRVPGAGRTGAAVGPGHGTAHRPPRRSGGQHALPPLVPRDLRQGAGRGTGLHGQRRSMGSIHNGSGRTALLLKAGQGGRTQTLSGWTKHSALPVWARASI